MEHFVGQYDIGRKCFLVGKAFAESAESLEKFPTFFIGMVTSRARALPNKTSVPL